MYALGQPVSSRDCSLQEWVETSNWQGTNKCLSWGRLLGELVKVGDVQRKKVPSKGNPIYSSCPCLVERQDRGTTLETEQLCGASQRTQLARRLGQDLDRESCAGLGVGLTLGIGSKKHPFGLCFPVKKPSKSLSCASAEVPFNKWQPGSCLIHSSTTRLQTNMLGFLKQCQSQ